MPSHQIIDDDVSEVSMVMHCITDKCVIWRPRFKVEEVESVYDGDVESDVVLTPEVSDKIGDWFKTLG